MKIAEMTWSLARLTPLAAQARTRAPRRAVLLAALVALLGAMSAMFTLAAGVAIGQARPPTEAQPQPHTRTVSMGYLGDRWLDTIQFRKIERATRDKKFGYNITYDLTGPDSHVLFWPRERIDFQGRSPRYRLEVMPLPSGRLLYPDMITAASLPDVHRCIMMIEGDYIRQADGAIAAMEGFATVASLGAGTPALRSPIPRPIPRTTLPTSARSAVPAAPSAAAGGAGVIAGGGSRGAGGATSAWTKVSRWMSPEEAAMWRGRTSIPQPAGKMTQVTARGAARPGAASTKVRVDFEVPTHALQPGGTSGWFNIFTEGRLVPIRDLAIVLQ